MILVMRIGRGLEDFGNLCIGDKKDGVRPMVTLIGITEKT
jgi:hypothetical protein